MRGRIIPVRGLSAADELAWRELAARAVEPNPFFEADCVIPAATHQTFGDQIGLVVAEEEGRLYAAMPIRAVRRWKFPYPIVTSEVRRMSYSGTPLVDATRGVEAMTALLTTLAEHRRATRGRILVATTVAADGPTAGFLRSAAQQLDFPVIAMESYERGMLLRRPEATYGRDHSSIHRHNLRRQRRRLEDAVGGPVVLTDRSDDPQAIDEYIELEAAGYKGRNGVALRAVLGETAYFTDMSRRFAAAGRLHLLALEAGGRTAAMEILVRGGDGLFAVKISYDEQFARFSPGILLQTEGIDLLHHKTDAAWIEVATYANNATILRLYPDRRRIEDLFVVLGRSVLDRAVVEAFLAARPVHKRYYDLRHREHGLRRSRRDGPRSGASPAPLPSQEPT